MARSPKSSNGSTKQPDKATDTSTDDATNAAADTAPEAQDSESVEVEQTAADIETPVDPTDAVPEPDEAVAEETAPEVPGVLPASVEISPPPPQPAKASGAGALGMVFGGLVAGAIGFLVATFALPEGWPTPEPSGLVVLQTSLAEQGEQLDSLAAEIAAVRDAPAVASGGDTAPLAERIDGLDARIDDAAAALDDGLAGLNTRLTDFETRLAELESRPILPAGADGSAAMEAQLNEFRQQLDAVTADAEARIAEARNRASQIEAEAAATAAEAERAAALSSLRVALDSGTPFADILSALPDAPDALAVLATDGVPTLGSLQSGFPAAAREALSEAQTVPESASTGDRLVAFLKRRTNARSLSPREGDDADAVLSRAEAALGNGDLDTALAELAALPDAAREAMSDWVAAAETRATALTAFAALETETK